MIITAEMKKNRIIDAVNESMDGVIKLGEWGSVIETGYCDKHNKSFRYWHNISDDEINTLYTVMQNLGLFDGLVKKIICVKCGLKARPIAFHQGNCPQCGGSIDRYGYNVIREKPQGVCDECQGVSWDKYGCSGECLYNMIGGK